MFPASRHMLKLARLRQKGKEQVLLGRACYISVTCLSIFDALFCGRGRLAGGKTFCVKRN